MSPHPALKPKTKEVLDKICQMEAAGEYLCPQSVARALGHKLAGRISERLKTLEALGYIKRINHTAHHVEIKVLRRDYLAGPG